MKFSSFALAVMVTVLLNVPAHAADAIVEISPVALTQHGVLLSAGVKPSDASRWTFLGSVSRYDIRESDDVVKYRLDWRVTLSARYRFTGQRSGLFGEIGLGPGSVSVRAKAAPDVSEAQRVFQLTPSIGYLWYPGRGGFYLAPVLGIDANGGKEGRVSGARYEPPSTSMRAEIRVGFQF